MNVDAMALWLKIGGVVLVVVGFGMLAQWYEETSNYGVVIASIGAVAAIMGFNARKFATLRAK